MSEITIQKSEYDSLLAAKAKAEASDKQIEKLEEVSENKSKAIEEERQKVKDLKKDHKTELDVAEEKAATLEETIKDWLELEEVTPEAIKEKLGSISTDSAAYQKILEKENEDRTGRIEKYEELLGSDFLEEKKDIFEWMDDSKKETLLKDYMEAKGIDSEWDWTSPKIVKGDDQNSGNQKPAQQWDFDKAMWTGDSSQVWNALANEI